MRPLLLAMVMVSACAQVEEQKPPPRVPEVWEIAGGTRLRAIFAVRGGVRQFIAFEDRVLGIRCTPDDDADGYYCKPHALPLAPAASDAECTQRDVALDETCDGTRKLISSDSPDGKKLFATRPLDTAYAFDGTCSPANAPAGGQYLVATEEVTRSSLVSFRHEDLDVGSRLKLRMLVADDGSRFVLGYHDTQLDIDCNFREAQDGRTRCVPAVSNIAWNVDCSKKLALYKVGATPPRIVTTVIDDVCRRHAFAATDLGFVPIAYPLPESACRATSTSPAVQLGEELPASEFVEETTQIVSDGQLTQTVRVIGRARVPGIIEDREFGDCTFSLDSGEYRCLPGAFTPYFFDSSCTKGFACHGSFVCGRPPIRFLFHRGTCSTTVRPIGAPVPRPTMMFSSMDGRCTPISFGSGGCEQIGPAGEVIPRSAFATAKLVAE